MFDRPDFPTNIRDDIRDIQMIDPIPSLSQGMLLLVRIAAGLSVGILVNIFIIILHDKNVLN